MKRKIAELISDKFSGEWGTEGSLENGVKVIRTTNFTNDGFINFDNVVYREINKKKIEAKRLRKGDIIIEKSGGSPSQPVGRVVYFDLDTEDIFLCNNFTSVLRPNRKIVHPKYLFYRLYEAHKEGRTLKYQNKTTGIINLKLEDYLNDSLEIPENIKDQLSIVTVLDLSESLIRRRKESISLLDEFLRSTFLEMFGDPILNPRKFTKDTLLNYFILEPQNGLYKPATAYGKGVRILRIDSFYDGKVVELNSLKRLEVSDGEVEKYGLREDEIVINRVNSREYLGKVCLIPNLQEATVFESNMMRFSVDKSRVNPVYLVNLLGTKYMRQQILRCAKDAVNQSSINQQDVKGLEILVPPLALQEKFAQILEETSKLKAHYNASLIELENLYGSLTRKAFAGELNIPHVEANTKPVNANEEPIEEPHPGMEQFNLWLRDYYINLPETTAPKEIDIKIKQLDTELKSRQEIPFWNEYVKYRIVKQRFTKAFEFDNLVTELSKFPFEQLPEYNTLKEMVFDWLRGEKPFLRQIFNEESNKMVLMVNEAASS